MRDAYCSSGLEVMCDLDKKIQDPKDTKRLKQREGYLFRVGDCRVMNTKFYTKLIVDIITLVQRRDIYK